MIDQAAGLQPKTAAVVDWLIRAGTADGSMAALLDGLSQRLCAAGLAIHYSRLDVHALHPLVAESTFEWRRENTRVIEIPRLHEGLAGVAEHNSQATADSPQALQRWSQSGSPAMPSDPVIAALITDGATDYLACVIVCGDGQQHRIGWATDLPAGFTDAEVTGLARIAEVLAAPLEALVTRRTAAVLLETYLGKRSGARVLAGEIQRGSGEIIHSVLWLSDLRGFTALSERLPSDQVIALLNAYFERLVGPIKAFRGEVLKFIGDGLLAIFPIDQTDVSRACVAALNAVRSARAGLAAAADDWEELGIAAPEFGVALHIGDVVYGNIGAPDRLDFTVIGPTVNAASRIESLCKPLGCPVLASADFAEAVAAAGQPLVSLGFHSLRGIEAPAELFTAAELAQALKH